MGAERWNSNLHAFEGLLRAVPAGAQTGLDVGCGEGETARRLRRRVASVVGVDRDVASIEAARAQGGDVDYRVGDLDALDLPDESFDVVTAVAMLHHGDHKAGLRTLARLTKPGGLLLVVGLAQSRAAADFARDCVEAVLIRRYTLTKGVWRTSAPVVWPPPLTYSEPGPRRSARFRMWPSAECRTSVTGCDGPGRPGGAQLDRPRAAVDRAGVLRDTTSTIR